MLIRIDVLHFLQLKNASFPQNTPRRLEKIREEVNTYISKLQSDNLMVHIGIDLPNGVTKFDPTLENVSCCINNLPRHKVDDIEKYFGKEVLMPIVTSCCARKIRIDTRHSMVRLYTKNGISAAFYYHGTCLQCKSKFYHNFVEINCYRTFRETVYYFVCVSSIGFSKEYLDFVTLLISIGSTSFEKICNIYNTEHKLCAGEMLRSDILENNWLLYRISKLVPSFFWKKTKDHHCDVEKICQEVYPRIRNIIDEKWINHRCDEVGCNARMVVIDGNQKLFRYCCAEPIEKITNVKGEINIFNCCINNPVRGNMSSVGSKKCLFHKNGDKENYVHDVLDMAPVTRSRAKELAFKVVSGEGCKEEINVNRFVVRTAGMLYVFRSCGIRVSHFEMFTAESLSLIFSSLMDLFYHRVDKDNLLSGVVYDSSCDLLPYMERLSREGNDIASYFTKLRYVVDIFHAEKHTQPKCDNKEECKFHPDLEIFSDIRNMNTEVCEQGFHLLNCYKHITRNMTYGKRLCFLKFIDDDFNNSLENKL